MSTYVIGDLHGQFQSLKHKLTTMDVESKHFWQSE
jgi:hypothetical protein